MFFISYSNILAELSIFMSAAVHDFPPIQESNNLDTRLRLVPGFMDPGSVLILGQMTQYGNPYSICISLYDYTYIYI